MHMLTPDGPGVIDVESEEEASEIGSYWSALSFYLATGDPERIEQFRGRSIGGVPFETDTDAIVEWWLSGEIDFLEIYES
jgi:hypothetical protein